MAENLKKYSETLEILFSVKIYPASIFFSNKIVYALGKRGEEKFLCLSSGNDASKFLDFEGFEGQTAKVDSFKMKICPTNVHNAYRLQEKIAFLQPQLAGLKKSFGCGDRLGLATPGHIRAIRKKTIFPVLAQQSAREISRTDRTPAEVMASAVWGVFEEGYRGGFGADADHIKNKEDLDKYIDAGFTMYTLDPSNYLTSEPGKAKYDKALAAVVTSYRYLKKRLKKFEVEISFDETPSPTTPEEHLYLASQLQKAGVEWISLALRFVGCFEKGVDYKGSTKEFADDLKKHMEIARHFGDYKISIHSGSDKFSLYPIISGVLGEQFHLKTAGTSYLAGLKVVAAVEPKLFRDIYLFALANYENDKSSYFVSADPQHIPALTSISDELLPLLLDNEEVRQVLHVTFGSVLRQFKTPILSLLKKNEEEHYRMVCQNTEKHLRDL